VTRRPFVAGNWKMHKTTGEAAQLVSELAGRVPDGVDAAVCPPFTALAAAVEAARGGPLAVYAQNMHWEPQGAYTGEISAPMLLDLGVDGVLLGHSERRQYFAEDDEALARKLRAAHAAGLAVIFAVGETEAQRERGETAEVLRRQLDAVFADLTGEATERTTVAYEPVWAIGTGRTATPEIAQEAHALIRVVLTGHLGEEAAQRMRIQYGGSVKPDNAAELLAQPDIDGALAGGASLEAGSFAALLEAAADVGR
jgi:triosephosphate isomerase (TIM)